MKSNFDNLLVLLVNLLFEGLLYDIYSCLFMLYYILLTL